MAIEKLQFTENVPKESKNNPRKFGPTWELLSPRPTPQNTYYSYRSIKRKAAGKSWENRATLDSFSLSSPVAWKSPTIRGILLPCPCSHRRRRSVRSTTFQRWTSTCRRCPSPACHVVAVWQTFRRATRNRSTSKFRHDLHLQDDREKSEKSVLKSKNSISESTKKITEISGWKLRFPKAQNIWQQIEFSLSCKSKRENTTKNTFSKHKSSPSRVFVPENGAVSKLFQVSSKKPQRKFPIQNQYHITGTNLPSFGKEDFPSVNRRTEIEFVNTRLPGPFPLVPGARNRKEKMISVIVETMISWASHAEAAAPKKIKVNQFNLKIECRILSFGEELTLSSWKRDIGESGFRFSRCGHFVWFDLILDGEERKAFETWFSLSRRAWWSGMRKDWIGAQFNWTSLSKDSRFKNSIKLSNFEEPG